MRLKNAIKLTKIVHIAQMSTDKIRILSAKSEVKMKQFETNKYDEEIKEYKNRLREIQKLDMNKEDKTILATFYQNSINNMKTLNDIGVIYG